MQTCTSVSHSPCGSSPDSVRWSSSTSTHPGSDPFKRETRLGGRFTLHIRIRDRSSSDIASSSTGTARLGEHPDAKIITSLPRSGQINAAQMLAQWGDIKEAYDGPDAVAAIAGVTPVTRQSGNHKAVHFRWACNKRFRVALTTFADNSRPASPWADDVYNRARARGHDHPHAVRILARAWIRVIYRCWHTGQPYDSNLHGGAQKLPIAA